MTNNNKIVVTRHLDLINLLADMGLIDDTTPVLLHANSEDIAGKDIIGVAPPKLAVYANSVTEVPLSIPKDLKDMWDGELPLEELKKCVIGEPVTYKVEKLDTRTDFSEAIITTRAATFLQYLVRENIIERRGKQHLAAVDRQFTLKEEIEGKPVLGHLPYHLAQYALDVTSLVNLYPYELRAKMHTYELTKQYTQGLFTYKVKQMD